MIFLPLIALCLSFAQSQKPVKPLDKAVQNQQAVGIHQNTKGNKNDSAQYTPLSCPKKNSEYRDTKTKGTEPPNQSKSNKEWTRSDIIAVAAGVSAFLQVIALCVTIGIMILSNRRQLRAYVSIDHAVLTDGTMLEPPQPQYAGIPGIVMIIKNTGNTPAYKLISWAEITVQPTVSPLFAIPPIPDKFYTHIGPNGGTMIKTRWFLRAITAEEIAAIKKGESAIYLHGKIEYLDVFKKRRHTSFRLYHVGVFPGPKGGATFNFCESGNDAT
jgi:hypothetical protein